MPFENQSFKIVINQFGRGVVITLNLVVDDGQLFGGLGFGEYRACDQFGDQPQGGSDMFDQRGGIKGGLLFSGVGVDFAADTFYMANDFAC